MQQNSGYDPNQESNYSMQEIIASLLDRIHTLEENLNAIGYDAKASKKRRFPSKRQSLLLESPTKALCVETIDPYKLNRVRFFHPLLHDPQSKVFSLPFASPISSMGGFDDCGLNWVPPAGSTLMVVFEGGNLDSAYYLGTIWNKDRGPAGSDIQQIFPSREYESVHKGHRKGYLVGPDDESQVYPPWNTESYNAGDIGRITQFVDDPEEQKRITYPNIYGFKTPQKHALKMTDGNPKCNYRHKRVELYSGGGNWMIFKDDHLHYGGQWSHPSCNPKPGGGSLEVCSMHSSDKPYYSDIHGSPIEGSAKCEPQCEGNSEKQCSKILGGHTPTPCKPRTKYCDSQQGTNRFFKHKNECRPYKGPGTPQNNRCDLPQTGIQFLSISGHTFVMDDSVEEPRGKPEWERSMENFDFGCNDKFVGRTYWMSMSGHYIMMSDIEEKSTIRGPDNFVRIESATGNRIELNDHTIGGGKCNGCPPNHAGEQRGVHINSTSNHKIKMIDHMNKQCSPCREGDAQPISKATKGYFQLESGYGMELMFSDDFSQEETQEQWLQLTHPQCAGDSDPNCNSKEGCEYRGPHFLRMQGKPKGEPGIVFLRAGGHAIRQTFDMDVVLVGDKECNPADKFTYVTKRHIRSTDDIDFRYSGQSHILFAEEKILLMAGRDCPPEENSEGMEGLEDLGQSKCKQPCLFSVIVARCPVFCPLTGILHWTEKSMSERVFASAYHPCKAGCSEENEDCSDYDQQMNDATCEDQETSEFQSNLDNIMQESGAEG